MKIAIIGSRDLVNNEIEVRQLINKILNEYKPKLVISGNSIGVDKYAIDEAMKLNIATKIYYPEAEGWYFYRERNKKIAENCDFIIRIVHKDTKRTDSGWTMLFAERIGKETKEFVIKETEKVER